LIGRIRTAGPKRIEYRPITFNASSYSQHFFYQCWRVEVRAKLWRTRSLYHTTMCLVARPALTDTTYAARYRLPMERVSAQHRLGITNRHDSDTISSERHRRRQGPRVCMRARELGSKRRREAPRPTRIVDSIFHLGTESEKSKLHERALRGARTTHTSLTQYIRLRHRPSPEKAIIGQMTSAFDPQLRPISHSPKHILSLGVKGSAV
jgi:hypothetical protein